MHVITAARVVAVIAGAHPAYACQLERVTAVPIERIGGLFVVDLDVNGLAAHFVLDTGAERSVVGLAAADRLHIARDEWVSTDVQGAGGRDRRRLGRPNTIALGGVALKRHTVAADHSVVVGPIPEHVDGQTIDGLLGQDFLSPFDLDLDPAAATLTLYRAERCSGHFLPWTGAYKAIATWRPVRNILALPLHIGSAFLQAELDTGAARSVITLPGMVQLGLAAGGSDEVRGFGPNTVAASTRQFDAVHVDGLPAAPVTLVVAPLHTLRSIGALLGADWVASRHLWVSWAVNTVYVQMTP